MRMNSASYMIISLNRMQAEDKATYTVKEGKIIQSKEANSALLVEHNIFL